jgi:MFS family permease
MAFVRAVAVGLIGVELGLYLAHRELSASAAGGIVGAGLSGAALASLAATLFAEAGGRRRTLTILALLGAAGAIAFASVREPAALGIAAFFGMLNGMGRDRGAALIVEQALLPSTVADRDRTRTLALYNVLQDVGHALGALLAGLPAWLERGLGASSEAAHGATFGLYATLSLAVCGLALALPAAVEVSRRSPGTRVSPRTRSILVRISSLFALDSLGGGFLTTALLTYYFEERFGAGEAAIAMLFAGARVLNAASHLVAAWLAKRIGLVRTMVFTHVPSSLLLVTVAWAPSFPVAAALLLLREGLVEMDVPTRQSYVLAIVAPHERTLASGVTHLVRLAAWAIAPFVAGPLMSGVSIATPLYVGAALKIAYDVALYVSFASIRPPEET